MAVISMDQAVIKIHDGSSLTDWSSNVISAQLQVTNNVGSYSTLGGNWDKSTEGNRNWTFNTELEPTDGASGTQALADGWMVPSSGKPGTRAFEGYVPDETTGSKKYSGNLRINDYNPINAQGGSGDPATISLNCTGDDTLTVATVA